MDILGILNSINKITIVAFAITIGFLTYEFYSFKKEKKKSEKISSLPSFNPNQNATILKPEVINVETPSLKKSNVRMLSTIISMVFFVLISIVGFSVALKPKTQSSTTPVKVRAMSSDGIKVFNLNWIRLLNQDLANLKGGDSVYIGLSTIDDPQLRSDIDQARIRVNESTWTKKHVTTDFNQENGVFYKKYTIATGSSILQIQAQLHSKSKGDWLSKN